MSYMPGLGRAMSDLLESSAENEELNADLKSKEFVAKIGKAYKIALLIASIAGVGFGISMLIWLDEWVALIFLCIGCCGFLILPSFFTWRCSVNSVSMTEECFILFIKYKKEVLWNDVKYQKFRLGENKSIVFYNQNKKRLISFDGTTVGFNQILKTAKRKGIVKLKNNLIRRQFGK